MKTFLAIILISAALLEGKSAQFNFKSRVGVVEAGEDKKLCLIIANPGLAENESLNLVVLSKQQRVVKARVREKLKNCSGTATDTVDVYWYRSKKDEPVPVESFYSVSLERADINVSDIDSPVIAVVSQNSFMISRGRARGDLDRDGRPEFFRYCASNEGLHFTVWTGYPLVGRSRWHFYYYLGYDVVPSCKRKDYM